MKLDVRIAEKYLLTIAEAAAYFNIGTKRLVQLLDTTKKELMIQVGVKRLVKRKKMEEFLDGISCL